MSDPVSVLDFTELLALHTIRWNPLRALPALPDLLRARGRMIRRVEVNGVWVQLTTVTGRCVLWHRRIQRFELDAATRQLVAISGPLEAATTYSARLLSTRNLRELEHLLAAPVPPPAGRLE